MAHDESETEPMSLGAAIYDPGAPETLDDLLRVADGRTYEEKTKLGQAREVVR